MLPQKLSMRRDTVLWFWSDTCWFDLQECRFYLKGFTFYLQGCRFYLQECKFYLQGCRFYLQGFIFYLKGFIGASVQILPARVQDMARSWSLPAYSVATEACRSFLEISFWEFDLPKMVPDWVSIKFWDRVMHRLRWNLGLPQLHEHGDFFNWIWSRKTFGFDQR